MLLPLGDEILNAKVKDCFQDIYGDVVGTFHNNPLLNTIIYDNEFSNGGARQYSANVIEEIMYSLVDEFGSSKTPLNSIVDFKKTERLSLRTRCLST